MADFQPDGEPMTGEPVCLAEISDGRIWCGFRDRIWEFDRKGWRLLQTAFDRVECPADGARWQRLGRIGKWRSSFQTASLVRK